MEVDKIAVLVSVVEKLLQSQQLLQQQLESRVPKYLSREYFTVSNDVLLTLKPQSLNLEHITSIIAYTSSGPATLTLGRRVLPINTGLVTIYGIDMWLLAGDVRTLAQSVAGPMYLELMGEEAATTGSGGAF